MVNSEVQGSSPSQGSSPNKRRDVFRDVYLDLHWYYNESAAAFGFRSGYSSFVSALYGVTPVSTESDQAMTDDVLAHARRYRTIQQTLQRLPVQSRRVLDACYNDQYRTKYPPGIVSVYGAKAGAALFSEHVGSLRDLTRLAQRKLRRELTDAEQVRSFQIGTDATRIWNESNQAYLTARSAGRNQ